MISNNLERELQKQAGALELATKNEQRLTALELASNERLAAERALFVQFTADSAGPLTDKSPFLDYLVLANKFAVYDKDPRYCFHYLNGKLRAETGELYAELARPAGRGETYSPNSHLIGGVAYEIGDILWYICQLAQLGAESNYKWAEFLGSKLEDSFFIPLQTVATSLSFIFNCLDHLPLYVENGDFSQALYALSLPLIALDDQGKLVAGQYNEFGIGLPQVLNANINKLSRRAAAATNGGRPLLK